MFLPPLTHRLSSPSAAAIPGDSKDSNTGLGVSGRIPDVDEQATGLELRELNAIKAGDEDPFGMAGVKVGPFGTKENPRIVPSHFESRIVGCYSECRSLAIHVTCKMSLLSRRPNWATLQVCAVAICCSILTHACPSVDV